MDMYGNLPIQFPASTNLLNDPAEAMKALDGKKKSELLSQYGLFFLLVLVLFLLCGVFVFCFCCFACCFGFCLVCLVCALDAMGLPIGLCTGPQSLFFVAF